MALGDLWLPDPTLSCFAPHHQQAWPSRPQGNPRGQAAQAGQTQPSLLCWARHCPTAALPCSRRMYIFYFFMIS